MNQFNILTGREDGHLTKKDRFLFHPRTYDAFMQLKEKLSHENIQLEVVSSFRNFERQSTIWNEKAQGKRNIYSRKGELLNYSALSKNELLHHILTWSAIPGASRHHWGTDLDVFDSNIKQLKDVQLNHQEYLEDFSLLTTKLSSLMNAKQAYDFFRPYALDNNGVAQELWHIGHAQVSTELDNQYTIEVFEENIKQSNIELRDLILSDLKNIFKRYVKNITI